MSLPCPLSPRELQILGYVAQGYSNPAIGGAVHLSPLTVKTHLARIFDRIGAENRAHAAAIAVRSGWVE